MDAKPDSLESFLWELRRGFRELTRAADLHLGPLGIQAGDRALLEFLARGAGPLSISEIARGASVSRQHIHQGLKRLPRPGWVEARPDPADGRTLLLRLSPSGRAFWKKVRAADAAFLERLRRDLPAAQVRAGVEALRGLRSCLATMIEEASHG